MHHIIDQRRIGLMKPTAILINTARGSLVNNNAFAVALDRRQIAAAGLDVYDHEPNVDPARLSLENVVLLPHLGSATIKTCNAIGMRAADNLRAFFAGEQPVGWNESGLGRLLQHAIFLSTAVGTAFRAEDCGARWSEKSIASRNFVR